MDGDGWRCILLPSSPLLLVGAKGWPYSPLVRYDPLGPPPPVDMDMASEDVEGCCDSCDGCGWAWKPPGCQLAGECCCCCWPAAAAPAPAIPRAPYSPIGAIRPAPCGPPGLGTAADPKLPALLVIGKDIKGPRSCRRWEQAASEQSETKRATWCLQVLLPGHQRSRKSPTVTSSSIRGTFAVEATRQPGNQSSPCIVPPQLANRCAWHTSGVRPRPPWPPMDRHQALAHPSPGTRPMFAPWPNPR